MNKEEVLQKCVIDGLVIKLPEIELDRKVYMDVAKSLELIGGKWKGGKIKGFIFNEDPSELLTQIANGEKRNLKKEFQFFATPDKIADRLVHIASITAHHSILEPSAGQGAIINAIKRKIPDLEVDCCELMPLNQVFLSKIDEANLIGEDFLTSDIASTYDRIIANPPFTKNQDIIHVKRMYDLLKTGGRLVSMMSKHWQLSSNKKETEFRNWIATLPYNIEEVDAGEFKESGTNISTIILTIFKE